MAKVIAFTGGCYSGKTSTLEALKAELESKGVTVKIISENIREELNDIGMTIDEVRSDANLYFKLQETIIRAKMLMEIEAFIDTDKHAVYLEDRAITDSLFYLENYVEKSNLTDENIGAYAKLHNDVLTHAEKIMNKYTAVVEFSPINNADCADTKYRPTRLKHLAKYEHDVIHIINDYFIYSGTHNFVHADLNRLPTENVIDVIMQLYNNQIKVENAQ